MLVDASGLSLCLVFFFQAEDGIRDSSVTGVQTCALPICIRLNLGLLRQEEFILTGASNAGLEEAGTNSILTMGKMAMTLFHTRPNFDELIKINIINIMVSQGISEFIKARKKLIAEENSLYINQ